MEERDDLFTYKHEQLSTISSWAKTLAPIVLFIVVVYALLNALAGFTFALRDMQDITGAIRFQGLLTKEFFVSSLETIVELVYQIMQGVVYYFLLKGISLGLDMIVETDINYRAKSGTEENDE